MNDNQSIKHAVNILRQGGLVALPTETVYGLGADATNPEAIKKIFAAKGRPSDHPLIVHISTPAELTQWARDIPKQAWQLAASYWPGPLTLILKKQAYVSELLTGGQDTIGLRIPNHPLALKLLQAFGGGIAAPSANRFGRISPTSAAAVYDELGNTVDYILDGGACQVGLESTIVDCSSDTLAILRPGMLTKAAIEIGLAQTIGQVDKKSPRVSGMLESHYAPRTALELITENLKSYLLSQTVAVLPIAILTHTLQNPDFFLSNTQQLIHMSPDPEKYAHDLYHQLRHCDQGQYQKIVVEAVPDLAEWAAIRDRLQRASYR